jgi:Protein of unknown function (DUF1566)
MGASRRAAVLVGLGALACAFAGCEALIGLNDFSVRDCSNDACDSGGAAETGPDGYADADASDSTADVAADTRDGGGDGGDASDAPDEGSEDVVVSEAAPDVAPPTVTEIWVHWPMPNPPNTPIALDSSVDLPHPMAYSVDDAGATVLDQVTNLTWESSGSHVNSYEDAERYCLRLAQSTKLPWRVPTRIELVSLIDWTRVPTFDVDAFAYDPADASVGQSTGTYWTSSLAVPPQGGLLPADASSDSWPWHWTVSFVTGLVEQQTPANSVRCVRGGS